MPVPPSAPEQCSTVPGHADTPRIRRRELAAHPGFVRLLVVRLGAQWGDGVFQAALGGAVLFNPERQSDPVLVALGLAVVLLPYSLVGPFAGALLDRWDRRRVFVVAGLCKAVLTLATAAVVAAGVTGAWLYLGALATIGVSRFVQAGLSAALPHVVTPRRLVAANSLVTTSGAVAAAVGASCAFALTGVIGAGDAGSGIATAASVVGSAVIVVVALGFVRGALGPDGAAPDETAVRAVGAVAHGLADGARAARSAPGVVAAFWAVAAHRLAFGVATLVMLLLMRHGLTDWGPFRAGMAGLGETVAVAAAGLGVAAVVTPWLTARLGRPATVRIMLVLAAAALLAFGLPMTMPTLLAASFLLGLVGQAIKLCSDAAVQREVDDAHRGRVFALSDTVFNVTYVLAVAAAALFSPLNGRSVPLIAVSAGIYLLGLVVHEVALRTGRHPGDTRGPDGGSRQAGEVHGGSQPGAPSVATRSTAPSPSTSVSSTSQRAEPASDVA
ncbi:MFS transporter [Actinomycetospora endophytica]|uniref:MFS transporter n=1 Tax=Actinomycetospora endophytica TaxID=2291215 RepID=A0ABS8P4B9_9PSEU|nr:MFS transporter [Actinomycetospora endophytica]MCD2193109.1 MFS transporter [Actinomycetospora endophytica]